ncbi:MAG: DUF1540 domain-containing protein [Clostridia bacterium]|nr:DUF1540 domain-containing protein [Clostridia bacterium]
MDKNCKGNVCNTPNKGIVCDVNNCRYNDGECHCMAEKISVGPSYANSCTDTVCATFVSKTEG